MYFTQFKEGSDLGFRQLEVIMHSQSQGSAWGKYIRLPCYDRMYVRK